jgi:hypothetical protein
MSKELPAPYVGASDTSKARAQREDELGVTSERRKQIRQLLVHQYTYGATWSELADETGLHHGQVSSVLTRLHEAGHIFQLRETRNNCHPYVHSDFRNEFRDHEVNDKPVKTRASQRVAVLETIATAAHDLTYGQSKNAGEKWDTLRKALNDLKEMDN